MDAKEKWLKKLIKYREKIANNKELTTKDITGLLNALFIHQNVSDEHELENLIVFELKHKLELIKPQLSKYFGCCEDKIKIGDLTCENNKSYNYLVVLGDVNCLGCKNCIFKGVECNLEWKSCWIKHKDLYSDKFLDQEVEIEVEEND